MMNKIIKNKAGLGVNAVIIAGILAALNFFSYQIFYTVDLTQNKDYSISAVTKQTVKNLDDIVNIKLYFSTALPSQYINLPQEVGDILAGYAAYSGGKIKYEFIDPKDDQNLAKELQFKGIPQLQFNVLEKDKYEVVNGYLGASIQYADKSEVIPVIQDTNNLEYLITSKIKKLTSKDTPTVGLVASNGTLSPDNDIKRAKKELETIYKVETVDLTAGEVSKGIKTLVFAGPKQEFSNAEQKIIDKFVMDGGSVLFLVDGVKVENNLQASANQLGLDKLFESYGLRLNKNLVLDTSSGIASFNQGFVTFNINYPFWPKIVKGGFNKDSVAVAKLESLVLPWVSSIDVLKDKASGANFSYLVKSSGDSWTQSEPFNLSPQQQLAKGKPAQYDLAVAVNGKLQSPFGNGSTDRGRVILVGDSDFLRDNLLDSGDSLIFFQNLVDTLTLDEDLINIRAKGIAARPLGELSDSARVSYRYLNVFGLTVLVLAFGLWRYYARRRSRMVDEF